MGNGQLTTPPFLKTRMIKFYNSNENSMGQFLAPQKFDFKKYFFIFNINI